MLGCVKSKTCLQEDDAGFFAGYLALSLELVTAALPRIDCSGWKKLRTFPISGNKKHSKDFQEKNTFLKSQQLTKHSKDFQQLAHIPMINKTSQRFSTIKKKFPAKKKKLTDG
jgi:hypothetical protein